MVMAMFIFLAPGVGLFLGLTGVALFGVSGMGFFGGLGLLYGEKLFDPRLATVLRSIVLGIALLITGVEMPVAAVVITIGSLIALLKGDSSG